MQVALKSQEVEEEEEEVVVPDLASSVDKKDTCLESALMKLPNHPEEEEEEDLSHVSSVVKKVICQENAPMNLLKELGRVVDQGHALNVAKRAICPESALRKEQQVVEVIDQEALRLASNANKKVICQENALMSQLMEGKGGAVDLDLVSNVGRKDTCPENAQKKSKMEDSRDALVVGECALSVEILITCPENVLTQVME